MVRGGAVGLTLRPLATPDRVVRPPAEVNHSGMVEGLFYIRVGSVLVCFMSRGLGRDRGN